MACTDELRRELVNVIKDLLNEGVSIYTIERWVEQAFWDWRKSA